MLHAKQLCLPCFFPRPNVRRMVLRPVRFYRLLAFGNNKSIYETEKPTKGTSIKRDYLELRCGHYVLTDIELDIFRGFVGAMSKAVLWLLLYGVVDLVSVCQRLYLRSNIVPFIFGDLFYCIESFAMAGVFHICGKSFKKLITNKTSSSDIPVIIEGIQRLNLAFSQVAFMSFVVAFFQTIDAACKTPTVLMPFSLMILMLTILRISCLRLLTISHEPGTGQLAQFVATMQGNDIVERQKYPLMQRLALKVSGRTLMGYSFLQRTSERDGDGPHQSEYEFSEFEENNVRMFIDSLRFSWLAYSLETGAYFLQGISAFFLRNAKAAISIGLNTFECFVMVGLLFKAASALDYVIGTKGKDITNLLRGFGPNGGMTQVFVQMKGLFRSLVIAKIMTLFV